MDNLFKRATDGATSSENIETDATPQQAAGAASVTVVNPLYAAEPTGEHAVPAGSPAPGPDDRAYVAEPALTPQPTTPTDNHNGNQPGRTANLLLIATLAAVCGLAGGLAGGAIMSAATDGSAQMAQGGRAPGAAGATSDGSNNGTSDDSAPNGQAPTGAPDANGSSDASADSSTDSSAGAPSDAPSGTDDSSATSQTSLSA